MDRRTPNVNVRKSSAAGEGQAENNDRQHEFVQEHRTAVEAARDVESGLIEVYFDNMDKPVMSTEDKTFLHGTVGLGSFDDVGNFDDLYVWGEAVE
jgi:hypothetical protein